MPLKPNPSGVRFGKGVYLDDIDWKMKDAAKKPGVCVCVLARVRACVRRLL